MSRCQNLRGPAFVGPRHQNQPYHEESYHFHGQPTLIPPDSIMIWFSVRDRAISIYGQTIPSLRDPTQDAEPTESENKVG